MHIKEQEIPAAVALPPVEAEHDYHSSMPHTPTASQSILHHLSTPQLWKLNTIPWPHNYLLIITAQLNIHS